MNISRWSAGFEVVHWESILDAQGQEAVFKKIATAWRLRQKDNSFNPMKDDARRWKPTNNFNATERRSKSSAFQAMPWCRTPPAVLECGC